MGKRGELFHVVTGAQALAEEAADRIEAAALEATRLRDRFTLVLAGGATPRALYRILDMKPRWGRIDWSRTEVFFSDERCVGPDDPASNYRMAHRALLRRVPIRDGNLHRIFGELPPEEAADRYDAEVRAAFGGAFPTFDLVLLGIGPDGHTASIFPASPTLKVTDRVAVAATALTEPKGRVTLTLPAINAARQVVFLVSGKHKEHTLSWVVEDRERGENARLPASCVAPKDGLLVFMVDRAAAPFLSPRRRQS
jgi:6-phosphogluconolactonase